MTEAADDPSLSTDLDALRDRVLNVIGHELRTPVTTLRGLAEALSDAGLDAVRAEIAPAIVRNARRLERLLDDLLVAAGITSTLPVGDPRPLRVDVAAREAWGRTGAVEELDIDIDGDGEPWVLASPEALERVLDPVFDNAVKYGRGAPSVIIRSDGRQAEVDVRSLSDLLHPDEIALVTEPFFRGYHAVTAAPGLGLGLTVARELTRLAGGRLEFVQEQEGEALTRIMLPCPPDPA